MEQLVLNNTIINIKIVYKKNKNTYFYFKNDYIQINASVNQTKKQIVAYIKKNEEVFLSKYKKQVKIKTKSIKNKSLLSIFGKDFNVIKNIGKNNVKILDNNVIITTKNNDDLLIDQVYKKYLKEILLEAVTELSLKYHNKSNINLLDVKYNTRYTTSRYGSCNPSKRTINFNLHLVNYDKKYLEYVFCHEIAHLVHRNHSKEFYNLLDELYPNSRIIKKELNSVFNS
ncbi:hypothetical protein CI105_05680 [Candidatus Izimaplasma bacterium ZiA1]|uniref:M48 family metallopeptidase n=1 Tax=Candidatus Izimoplasma sp. ZiA1 TaxID=2024899 RepID=UPI000BAA6FCF|nr:hypothetical protein CI105_05680 [Candidatus Izimaplasma bacterium ZiA1]